ncbi:AI-2E family transporter [Parasediminibacterium paludis]|uniref:AI-2E family transporter n=1 Tax=Parasediminibacterium paludis TaxID=908966 RepID=A0ABV8Q1M5_9BACT
MENNQDYKINRYFFLAVIIVFGAVLLWSLMEFFTAFLAAVMFYVLSKPLIYWLGKQWNWKRNKAAILVIILSFFIILLPIGIFATMIYSKVIQVAAKPDEIIKPIKHFGDIIQQRFGVNIISVESLAKIQSFGTQIVSTVLNGSFNFFTTISMMYFFLYFMIVNAGRLEAALILYLPFKRNKMALFGDELKAQTFSNAVGVPLICVMHGLLAFLAYFIAGVSDAGFWAVVTGFASVIPLVGTGLIWLPTSIYLLAQGHTWQGIFVIVWGLLVIGTSDNVIRFVLAKRMADVHPIVTVLGVIIGLRSFGITGLIFGPLIISYFLILLKIYYVEYQKPETDRKRTLLPSYLQFKPSNTKRKQD